MWSLVLAMSLAGAPKAPADAQVIGFAPAIDKLGALVPFFEKAGTRSVLARPENWKTDAHALLEIDFTNPEALKGAGIDATGPLTRAQVGDATMSCVRVSNLEAYRKGCDARLGRVGEVFEKVVKEDGREAKKGESGVSIYASRDPIGRVMAAYSVQGKDSCALNGHGRSVEALFGMLARATSKPASGSGWAMTSKVPGVLQLVVPSGSPTGVVALNAKEFDLTLDGRFKNAPLAQFAGGGASPLGTFRASGMLVVRGRVSKAQLPSLVEQVARVMPNGAALLPVARTLAPLLTGNSALLLSHVKVSSGLRTRDARFFAMKSALLAEVTDAAAAQELLVGLDAAALKSPYGALSVTLEGNVLVVSNDAETRARAVAALARASGKQLHGVEFDVDPKAVAKGLQQVPLLEAVQTPELAAVIAASTELGPLLLASSNISGWLDSGDGHTARLVWTLDAAKFAPDAGVDAGADAGVK